MRPERSTNGQLIYDKAPKNIQWEKNNLFDIWCWKTGQPHVMKFDHYLVPHKNLLKCIKDFNVRIISLLKKNTWVWVNSRSWWWTGKPSVLPFMGSQRVGHDWATELSWTDGTKYSFGVFSNTFKVYVIFSFSLWKVMLYHCLLMFSLVASDFLKLYLSTWY